MTDRTRVQRLPERGVYGLDEIRKVLDSNFVCHVAYVADHGPVVLPTLYAVEGDTMYLHGSTGSHMLRTLKGGAPVCVAVTNVDGIVAARSVFHHSINYRSVVVFGNAVEVTDVEEKLNALRVMTNHMLPGRWDEARRPSTAEFTQTAALKLPINESSAKVRTGWPKDDAEDLGLPVWAGVLPFNRSIGVPLADPALPDAVAISDPVRAAMEKWRTKT